MVPFGKQQEILRDLRRQVQKSCQETAGRLFIEDGVVVISNEKSESVYKSSRPGRKTGYPDKW